MKEYGWEQPDFVYVIGDLLFQKILRKSVARFARNTIDALYWIQQLKELHIAIYFDKKY